MSRLNISTRALPGWPSTCTVPSIVPARPSSGLPPLRIVQPSQMPVASATYTWRVQMARPMARIGGSSDRADGANSAPFILSPTAAAALDGAGNGAKSLDSSC